MSAVTVIPARSKEEITAWITFPRQMLYPRSSPWVPPLDGDLRRLLDRRKNPFFRHGTGQAFLARDRSGRVAGRILAQVCYRHNVRHGQRAAFFGYFECRDDPAVAAALLDAATAFGVQHGCTVLRGPFNMTAMQEMGILVDGFSDPPAVDEAYTPPYYPALLAACGLTPVFPVTTFRVDELGQVDSAGLLGSRHHALLAQGRLRIRPANLGDYHREIETLRELLNDSFYDNPHFVPISREEFAFQIGPFKRLMDPAISLVAEIDGVPCGFAITLPDFNPLLKRMNGRLGPRELLIFLLGRRHLRDAALIIMGVQRGLQGQGIMRVLQADLIGALRRRGYRRLTITWIADGNAASLATARALGARPLHRLTLYEKCIGPASLTPDTSAQGLPGEGADELVPRPPGRQGNAASRFVEGARLAPSAHNTQPWQFVPDSAGGLEARWQAARALPAGDPTGRDLYLGLGAAVESTRLQAAAAGVALVFQPAPDDGPGRAGTLLPRDGQVDPADVGLAALLPRRQTARVPHLAHPLGAGLLRRLVDEAERAGCRLHITTDRGTIKRLARLSSQATASLYADPAVHAELWHWLRLDPQDPRYFRDGLTAECLDLHGLTLALARFLLPPQRMRWLVRMRLSRLLALDTERVIRASASLCLLTAPSASRADLLETGRVLQRLWLIAAEAGLTTHPVSALLDCTATVGPVLSLYGAAGRTPAAIYRMGATPPVPRAPRLPLEELLTPEHPL